MKSTFKWLGYAGLLPFFAIPLLCLTDLLPYYRGFEHFVQYSAIILSFFGGIHWHAALSEQKVGHQVFVAMLPSIVAWLSLVFLQGELLLSVLSIAYVAMLMYDKYVLVLEKQLVIEYSLFRTILTTLVVLAHIVMASI